MNYGYFLLSVGVLFISISNAKISDSSQRKAITYGLHLCLIVPGAYAVARSFFDPKSDFFVLLLTTLALVIIAYGLINSIGRLGKT